MIRFAPESNPGSRFQFPLRPGRDAPTPERYPTVPSLSLQPQPLIVPRRRVAVIGTGCWGQGLVRTFAELGSLRAVCDSDPALLALQPNGTVRHYLRVEDCLHDPEISAVAIATPVVSHFELVRSALRAGKDVFVEKPLALTVRDGQELVRYAANSNRILMVGNVLRFHPAVGKLKDMIDAGELGRVEYVCSSRPIIDRLRAEESILWSFAPHDVSVILGLLGDVPIAASCQGGDYVEHGVSDVTISQLQFAGGVRAQIFVSRLRPFNEQRLVVVGSDKMAVFDESAPNQLMTYPRRDWKYPVPTEEEAPGEPVPVDVTEPMKAECQAFLASLDSRRPPVSNGSEELRVLEVLDACERSLASDGTRTTIQPLAHIRAHHTRYGRTRNNDRQPASAGMSGAPGVSNPVPAEQQPRPCCYCQELDALPINRAGASWASASAGSTKVHETYKPPNRSKNILRTVRSFLVRTPTASSHTML